MLYCSKLARSDKRLSEKHLEKTALSPEWEEPLGTKKNKRVTSNIRSNTKSRAHSWKQANYGPPKYDKSKTSPKYDKNKTSPKYDKKKTSSKSKRKTGLGN